MHSSREQPQYNGNAKQEIIIQLRGTNNRTLLMYGVAGETRPIFDESDAFLYNPVDPTI